MAELVEAVREWVDGDVRTGTEGRLSFHARVATNALRDRSSASSPSSRRSREAHAERLRVARLRRRRRAGRAASAPATSTTASRRSATLVAASVHDKLLVANPGWLDED